MYVGSSTMRARGTDDDGGGGDRDGAVRASACCWRFSCSASCVFWLLKCASLSNGILNKRPSILSTRQHKEKVAELTSREDTVEMDAMYPLPRETDHTINILGHIQGRRGGVGGIELSD